MKTIRIACFSAQGEKLGKALQIGEVTRFPCGKTLSDWTREGFRETQALIFIGACAIAVRSVAAFLESKLTDPAVLVIDELGEYVIPILSGHIGGANELAQELADRIDASAVITTATDRRHTFAADSWAVQMGLGIVNPEAVKSISSSLLDGQEIVLSVRDTEEKHVHSSRSQVISAPGQCGQRPDSQTMRELRLVPQNIVVGAGCRKGTDPEYLEFCFHDFCGRHDIEPASVGCLASIDLKREERALVQLGIRRKIPFLTYSAQELMSVKGEFTASGFVQQTTGADNVCERAAVCACIHAEGGTPAKHIENDGILICRKEVYEGVTLAAARLGTVRRWQWTEDCT